MTSSRAARLARQKRSRQSRQSAQMDRAYEAIWDTDEFRVEMPKDGTATVTFAQIRAQVAADLAADGETDPVADDEVREFLALDIESGDMELRPDGRWRTTGGHLHDCLAFRP